MQMSFLQVVTRSETREGEESQYFVGGDLEESWDRQTGSFDFFIFNLIYFPLAIFRRVERGSRDGMEVYLPLDGGSSVSCPTLVKVHQLGVTSSAFQPASLGSSLAAALLRAVFCRFEVGQVQRSAWQSPRRNAHPQLEECSSVWIKGLHGWHEGKDPSCWVHWVESWVLELRSFWIRVNPTSDDKCPQRKEEDREKATWSWRLSLEFAARSLVAPRS